MPIYEYEREDGSVFEFMQKISDSPLDICPTTGQPVKRLISQNAFHLKGGGWYKTDYAGKKSGDQKSSTPSASSSGTTEAPKANASSTSESTSSSSSTGGCGTTCGCH